MAAPEIVTLLFTDLVGSTELLERLGEDAAEAVRRTHFRLLREAVAARGGQEVKNLGDGLMVVFPSAFRAVSCAVAMQQAVHRHNQAGEGPAFHVRVGLHVGEPIREEGDYFGASVVVAKRLCDAASGGQVLASELVRGLVGPRGEHEFQPLGPLALKGLAEPVPGFAVEWEPLPPEEEKLGVAAPSPRPVTLPAGLLRTTRSPFAGRAGERQQLREAWAEVRPGQGRLVFVTGEPGIGKTRLCLETALEVLEDGGSVLYGRCDEESVVPYQPFVEALGQLAEAGGIGGRLSGEERRELARLVPGLAGGPGAPEEGDPETSRYRLFQAVAAVLAEASMAAPLLFILDDLHWAAKPTVLLLRHLVPALEPVPILLLGTYRDVELTRVHPLSELLAGLRREGAVDRVHLGGLSVAELGELVVARAGHEVEAAEMALYEQIWAEAEGNPFFILEIVRHLVETGRLYQRDGRWTLAAGHLGELDLPEGVRDILGRRFSRLSEESNTALAHAAVLGREFEFDVLAHMAGMDEEAALEGIEEAVAARLVTEVPGRPSATYSFSHALVRDALLGEQTQARKERLHLRAAEAIEIVYGEKAETQAAALAGHYRQAGRAAPAVKAIDYSLQAGEAAARVLALEEAAVHWQAALDLLEAHGGEPERRAHLLRRLSDLMYVTGLDLAQGVAYGEKALALFEELGDEGWAARMHSRLGRDLSQFVEVMDIPRAVDHLRAAEAVLAGGRESAALAYVNVSLAASTQYTMRPAAGLAPARKAVDLGRRLGRPAIESSAAMVLGNLLALGGSLAEGLEIAAGAWSLADRLDHPSLGFHSARICGVLRLHLLDPVDAAPWLERELGKPRLAQTPHQRRLLQASLAWARALSGRLDEAGALVSEAAEVSVGFIHAPPLELFEGDWEGAERRLRRERDRYQEVGFSWEVCLVERWGAEAARLAGDDEGAEELRRAALALEPNAVLTACLHLDSAVAAAEGDRLPEAREHLERARRIMSPDEDWRGLGGRLLLAEAVTEAAAGDLAAAEAGFGRAVEVFRRYELVWEEAEALLLWGRALQSSGDLAGAGERFATAAAVYQGCHAQKPWLERLAVERARV